MKLCFTVDVKTSKIRLGEHSVASVPGFGIILTKSVPDHFDAPWVPRYKINEC